MHRSARSWFFRFYSLAFIAALGGCCLDVTTGTTLSDDRGTSGSTGGYSASSSGVSAAGSSSSSGSSGASSGTSSGGAASSSSSGGGTTSAGGATSSGTTTGRVLLWLGGVGAVDVEALNDAGTAAFVETCVPSADYGSSAVVDGQGDLWASQFVQSPYGTWITMWTPEQLMQSCSAPGKQLAPLGGGEILNPMAFDSRGYLWAFGNWYQDFELDGWSVARLRQGLDVSGPPDLAFEGDCSTLSSLCRPVDVAVDLAGSLWVTGWYSIVAFSPGTVIGDGGRSFVHGDRFLSTAPAVQLYDQLLDAGMSNIGVDTTYGGLAFDAAGNLWIVIESRSHPENQQLVEFSEAQLENLVQNPTPSPIASIPFKGNEFQVALAFDSDGDLWLAANDFFSGDAGILFRFSPWNLATGSPPDRLIVPTPYVSSLAFSPIPPGLPLQP